MTVDAETIREIVRNEILRALREDPDVRRAVWLIAHSEFVDTVDAARRFYPAPAETRRDDEQMRPTSRPKTGHRSP
ncbi:MAG: hypothetical protein KAX65_04235 [Caldilineaceae bacterium]|nr:hypothetical protein [Caldilineaceae bacterium]